MLGRGLRLRCDRLGLTVERPVSAILAKGRSWPRRRVRRPARKLPIAVGLLSNIAGRATRSNAARCKWRNRRLGGRRPRGRRPTHRRAGRIVAPARRHGRLSADAGTAGARRGGHVRRRRPALAGGTAGNAGVGAPQEDRRSGRRRYVFRSASSATSRSATGTRSPVSSTRTPCFTVSP